MRRRPSTFFQHDMTVNVHLDHWARCVVVFSPLQSYLLAPFHTILFRRKMPHTAYIYGVGIYALLSWGQHIYMSYSELIPMENLPIHLHLCTYSMFQFSTDLCMFILYSDYNIILTRLCCSNVCVCVSTSLHHTYISATRCPRTTCAFPSLAINPAISPSSPGSFN